MYPTLKSYRPPISICHIELLLVSLTVCQEAAPHSNYEIPYIGWPVVSEQRSTAHYSEGNSLELYCRHLRKQLIQRYIFVGTFVIDAVCRYYQIQHFTVSIKLSEFPLQTFRQEVRIKPHHLF